MEERQIPNRKRPLKVYTIVEKPGLAKGIWLEIGVASRNRDGSLRAKLDALPVSGTIHIREYDADRNVKDNPDSDQKPLKGWQ